MADTLKVIDENYLEGMQMEDENGKEEMYRLLTGKQRLEVRKDWRACPLSKWNATTARAYLMECTKAKFKVDYICNNIRQENAMLSQFIKLYGRQALKEFIYACMKAYKGNKQYPFPTFHFMFTYMRERHLPVIIYKIQQEEERRKELEAQKEITFVSKKELF